MPQHIDDHGNQIHPPPDFPGDPDVKAPSLGRMPRREPAHPQAPYLLALVAGASKLRDARKALEADVVEARDIGQHTWREIADAVGMTTNGVAKLYERTADAVKDSIGEDYPA